MRPELFSIFGPIFAIGCCAGIILWMKGFSVEKPNDMLRVRAVAVWLPVLLGLILTVISTITLWFGLWIAMTVAILNTHRNKWEREQLRAVRGRLGKQ